MSSVDQSHLERLLDTNRIGILDGGLATYLEDGLNFDLSKGPLWSARLLDEKEADVSEGKGPKGIFNAHLHYLEAGAGVIGTATYQASLESFARAQYTESVARDLMTRAVDIAAQSLEHFLTSNEKSPSARPVVCLSLGPYGAMLSNGAEYTGNYSKTFLPDSDPQREAQPSLQEMADFHQRRIEAFMKHPSWSAVGIVALETIPRADEALAFRMALENICDMHEQKGCYIQRKPVYLSFVYPHDSGLPWPPRSMAVTETQEETEDEEMRRLLEIAVGVQVQGRESKWPTSGVGINCTKPAYLPNLVDRMSASLAVLNKPIGEAGIDLESGRLGTGMDKPLLFLYPDGGLLYDAVKKTWFTTSNASTSSASDNSALSWATSLMKLARETTASNLQWKGIFVGGCCKSGLDEIKALCKCRGSTL